MTVNVEQCHDDSTGPGGRSGRGPLIAFAVIAPLVVALVVAAGFTHPWNAGGGIAAGVYTRDYSITQQVASEDLGHCLQLTLAGTMTARYRSPTWSLGGPGWTDPRLSNTSIGVRAKDSCNEGVAESDIDAVALTQFWATETCGEPVRGEWELSMRLGRCDQDLVAGVGGRRSTVSGSSFTASFSGGEDLTWRGTMYGDSMCVDGAAGGDVTQGTTTTSVLLDGYRICLGPDTANRP
ncbi:hypothetical protein [Kineosporia sp. NBRC 101731]|uniref:hypothetical protein n=1 Tax=Kineosporia sp. NBRC 101731 TaxID=3032199 RepID=UPI00249FB55C|nr:hypothetical protein [Kineosporia sp. NBRC 101731]GLY30155.1 hypothetical protein Kisp02_35200 [Kineosporia sp. NBRC 101731]